MDNNTTKRSRDRRQRRHMVNPYVRHPKVLVVEDDISYEPVWRKIFESVDPEIEYAWCTTAQEAQEILNRTLREGDYWDLVIADIFLSGSSTGLDLWERCGEPIENMIIVSSVDYSKLLHYIDYASTPPVYLKKPLKIQECIGVVRDMVATKPSNQIV